MVRKHSPSLVCLALLSLLAACSEAPLEGPAKRVILVACDTLRADRLGIYGYDRPTTPSLDAFARESVVFLETYACAPHTGPAMSSLFTGRLPDEVGVAAGNRSVLPSEVTTLAERLGDAGIPSAAIVSNWALRELASPDIGVRQGFLLYDDDMNKREPNRPAHFERTAGPTTEAALRWLTKAKADGLESFFLWVHYMDPHGPYTPPRMYLPHFEREPRDDRVLPFAKGQKGKGKIPKYQSIPGEHRVDVYRDRYDAEIRYFDDNVGRLFDWLRANDMYDDSLIFFTSDHGESLGEHDYWFCHGENVYRDVVRVPFLVRFPEGSVSPGVVYQDGVSRVDTVTSHLDVWPTVLAAFGLDPGETRGVNLFAERVPEGRVVAQTFGEEGEKRRHFALSDGRWRLIEHGGRLELYDVANDPFEETNLAARNDLVIDDLRARFEASLEAFPMAPPIQGVPMEMSAEDLEAMAKLGYADSGE